MKFNDADLFAMFFLCIFGWVFGLGGMIRSFVENDYVLAFPCMWLLFMTFWMTLVLTRGLSRQKEVIFDE